MVISTQKYFAALTILLLLGTCVDEERITFDSPQPEEQKNEDSFPRKLIGEYWNEDDSAKLTITRTLMITTTKSYYAGPLSDSDGLDSIIYHRGDTSFSWVGNKLKSDFAIRGDSLYGHSVFTDTIADLDDRDVIRKLKRRYLISTPVGSRWIVRKLELVNGGVIVAGLSYEDLKKLREITDHLSDTVYNFQPTKKELKTFVEVGGFRRETLYLKIEK